MFVSTFDSESFCGYTQKTTFWMDFSIADNFGLDAIQDTFNRAFNEWKDNYEYLTELVMVMNWKMWEWCEKDNSEYSKLYERLWTDADQYAIDNLGGEELSYFLRTTD